MKPCKNTNCIGYVNSTYENDHGGQCSLCINIGPPGSELRETVRQVAELIALGGIHHPYIFQVAEIIKKYGETSK